MSDSDKAEERPFGGFSTGSGYEGALEDGKYYPARLVGLKERNITQGQWPGWKVIWGFDVTSPAERIEAMTSTATGEGSTAGEWLTALLGAPRLEEHRNSRPITGDELRGRECMILVGFSDKGWPKVRAVFPPQSSGAAAVPPPPAAAPPPPPPPSQGYRPTATAADFDDLPFDL